MRVISRQRLRYPSCVSQRTGRVNEGWHGRALAGRAGRAVRTALPDLPDLAAHRQFRADDRPQPRRERGLVKPRGAVDAIAIEQGERRVAQLGGALDERFRQRRGLEKTECGRGVELDVHGGPVATVQSQMASMNQPPVARSMNTRYEPPSLSVTSHSSRSQLPAPPALPAARLALRAPTIPPTCATVPTRSPPFPPQTRADPSSRARGVRSRPPRRVPAPAGGSGEGQRLEAAAGGSRSQSTQSRRDPAARDWRLPTARLSDWRKAFIANAPADTSPRSRAIRCGPAPSRRRAARAASRAARASAAGGRTACAGPRGPASDRRRW